MIALSVMWVAKSHKTNRKIKNVFNVSSQFDFDIWLPDKDIDWNFIKFIIVVGCGNEYQLKLISFIVPEYWIL